MDCAQTEKLLIEIIDQNVAVVNNADDCSMKEVVTALNIVSQSCVRLFFVKALKSDMIIKQGENEKFDFWNAVQNDKLEKCFGSILVAKIKGTVRRCQTIIPLTADDPQQKFYCQDLIDWCAGIADQAKEKITAYCKDRDASSN